MSVQVKQVARDLLERLEVVETESASIRADLNVLLDGEVETPARTRNGPRSPKGAKVARQRGAAKARAKKEVGEGRNRVGSKSTQRKLKKEAQGK